MLCGCALKQGVFHRYIQSVIGYLVVPNYSLDSVGNTLFLFIPLKIYSLWYRSDRVTYNS